MATAPFSGLSSGLPGLDRMLHGLLPGDNVVWQVDTAEDYQPFVRALCAGARDAGRDAVYFRFARHHDLLSQGSGADIRPLNPEAGFDTFLAEILDAIEQHGAAGTYVFDCLSDLAADWHSDRMLSNFFAIVCPYVLDRGGLAYFAMLKNYHSFHATDGIHRTAQVILDVYRQKERIYLQPMKVFGRHSPTMYMLHEQDGDDFRPVTNSATITEILAEVPQPWLDFTIHRLGVWTRTLMQAQEVHEDIRRGERPAEEGLPWFERLLKMAMTRDDRFLALTRRYFELGDLVAVTKRMIGTGLIGGKSLGMLLARTILQKTDPRWRRRLEMHDSFFVGSDVFYTYVVENGCWWLRRKSGDLETLLARSEDARRKILAGTFPEYIRNEFREMLEYFGQSPIIVRSSSLLEDNYGNAFSGKYESVFCANQGTPEERLEAFTAAVRQVYASTMNRDALLYRDHYGLLDRDEQMAILVQRVSGVMLDGLFSPQLAGVGFSFNPYVWDEAIDPHAGVLRVVLGLGTRAVNRTEDDYTRLVALNVPALRPEADIDVVRQYSQRRVDVLDLGANALVTRPFEEVAGMLPTGLLERVATRDEAMLERARAAGAAEPFPWVLTFDRVFAETSLAAELREMLHILQGAYNCPVDVEFTVNFLPDGRHRINLVQCRPFQTRIVGRISSPQPPEALAPERVILESQGPIIGQSFAAVIDRLIYIVPAAYARLSMRRRHGVARAVGKLTRLEDGAAERTIMLVGPGRWGTSMPALGLPVTFGEISRVSVLGEVAVMHEGLVPDVSLGTHFFNDLVEMGMLYLAVFPERDGYRINESFFARAPNRLVELLPEAAALVDVIRVIDSGDPEYGTLQLNVDALKQRAVCYLES